MNGINIFTGLGKVQKQLIFNIKPNSENKGKVFDSIIKFMEFRDFSLADSVRPTYAVFKKKRGFIGIFKDTIKVRIKTLEYQLYVMIGSNMVQEDEKEKFEDEIDALKQFVDNKFKLKGED